MIRVIKQSGRYYGLTVDIDSEEEQENIELFTSEGTPVILVNDIEDLEEIDIDPNEVEMV